MNEAKILLVACAAMLVMSFLTAWILFINGAGPLLTTLGAPVVGIIVYMIICAKGAPVVKEEIARREENCYD